MLNFTIISTSLNANGDKIFLLQIPPAEIITMGYIIESLEGWAFHTIIDKERFILHVEVIRDYVECFDKLMEKMKK
jgi:hypothetical protein